MPVVNKAVLLDIMSKKLNNSKFTQITNSVKKANSLDCLKIIKKNAQCGAFVLKDLNRSGGLLYDKYVLNFTDSFNLRYTVDADNFITELSKDFKKIYLKKNKLKKNISIGYDFFNDSGVMANNWFEASILYKKDRILDHDSEKTPYEIDFEVFQGYLPLISKRNLLKKKQRSAYLSSNFSKNKCFRLFNDLFTIIKNLKITLNNSNKIIKTNQGRLYNARNNRICIQKYFDTKNYPIVTFLKKTSGIFGFQDLIYETFEKDIVINEYRRHPAAQFKYIKKNINISFGYSIFFKSKVFKPSYSMFSELYKLTWRYFKYKIERFFYNHLHVRLHI